MAPVCASRKEESLASKDDARLTAEARFERARKTTEEAKSLIDREREATRKKTEQLRQLRLAKEAAVGIADSGKKPARKNTKAKSLA